MKKLLFISLLVCAFVSCDGKKSHRKSLSESITEPFYIEIYKPQGFVERDVDTLLSNGFKVNIKTYVDATKKVTYTRVKDSAKHKIHYKNFKFDISVEKEGKLIFKNSFDKLKANKLFGFRSDFVEESPFYNFDKLAVLKSVQIDDEASLKNRVLIDFIYAIPETNRYTELTLFIREDGSTNTVNTKVN